MAGSTSPDNVPTLNERYAFDENGRLYSKIIDRQPAHEPVHLLSVSDELVNRRQGIVSAEYAHLDREDLLRLKAETANQHSARRVLTEVIKRAFSR